MTLTDIKKYIISSHFYVMHYVINSLFFIKDLTKASSIRTHISENITSSTVFPAHMALNEQFSLLCKVIGLLFFMERKKSEADCRDLVD